MKLYHRIKNKESAPLDKFVKGVIKNGLITHDNGEIGKVIWFSDNFEDYAKKSNFAVSIEYNEINKKKYELYYDGGRNGFAYKNIPFKDLEVVKMPIVSVRNRITLSSDEVITSIEKGILTSGKLNILNGVTIFKDAFLKYVDPHIDNGKEFINTLDKKKIKIINVF